MDAVDVLVALAALAELEGRSRSSRSRPRAARASSLEPRRELERRQLRALEDLVRVRAADAGDARWSRSSGCSRRGSPPRISPSASASSSSASGPEVRELGLGRSGVKSQTPARFFLPASVRTSSPPSSKRSRNIGVFGPFAPARGSAAGRRSSGARAARARRRRSGRAGSCRGAARPRAGAPRASRAAGRTSSAWPRVPGRPADGRARRAGRARAPKPRLPAAPACRERTRADVSRLPRRCRRPRLPRWGRSGRASGGRRGSAHLVHAVASATARSWKRPATGARDVPALLGEAAPGPTGRARSRDLRRGDRDRLRVAPRPPEQLDAVRCLLRGAGDRGRARVRAEPTPLEHNCSGKHAGFLALCRARGWPSGGYRPEHPSSTAARRGGCRRRCRPRRDRDRDRRLRRRHLRALARADGADSPASRRRGRERGAAMRAHPDLIRGPLAADSMLMRRTRAGPRRAEPKGCSARGSDGLGLAMKVEDGTCVRCGPRSPSSCGGSASTPASSGRTVENSVGELVGEVATVVDKRWLKSVPQSGISF